MTWNDVLDRLRAAGLKPAEETYMEHYGKVLAANRPEFQNRTIRCTYGRLRCAGLAIEIYLFPSEGQLQDFMELMGDDPWWVVRENAIVHFPVCDPDVVKTILSALTVSESRREGADV